MPITRDEVIWGFRFLLGRDPEGEEAIAFHQKARNIQALRETLLSAREFRLKAPARTDHAFGTAPDLDRRVIVFLHIPKCAGTTLHKAILAQVDDPMCPERHNGLGNWPAGMLARYSLFSGHFDITTLGLIPARRLSIVTMLRRPEDRLISAYRYLRSLRSSAIQAQGHNLRLAQLARDNDPATFFRHPDLARHPTINNGMVRMLSGPLAQKRWEAWYPNRKYQPVMADRAPQMALRTAVESLGHMTAFGVVEQFAQSIHHIFDSLGLDHPAEIHRRNAMDDLVKGHPGFRPIPKVELTEELEQALAPHVSLDRQLYDTAIAMLVAKRVGIPASGWPAGQADFARL